MISIPFTSLDILQHLIATSTSYHGNHLKFITLGALEIVVLTPASNCGNSQGKPGDFTHFPMIPCKVPVCLLDLFSTACGFHVLLLYLRDIVNMPGLPSFVHQSQFFFSCCLLWTGWCSLVFSSFQQVPLCVPLVLCFPDAAAQEPEQPRGQTLAPSPAAWTCTMETGLSSTKGEGAGQRALLFPLRASDFYLCDFTVG